MTALVEPVGPEIVIGENGAFPSSTLLSSGNYVVTWLDMIGQNDTLVQVFSSNGSPISSPYSLAAAINYHALAPLTSGGFVVVYTTNGQALAQIFDPNGATTGATITLGSIDYYSTANIGVAELANGGFAASWKNVSTVSVHTYDASGSPVATLTADIGAGGVAPQIVQLSNGTIVLTWHEYDSVTPYSGGNPDGLEVAGQLFSAAGAPLSSKFIVNQTQLGSHAEPIVTELASGEFVVTWVANGAVAGIMAQIYDASGAPVGSNIHISDLAAGYQSQPSVSALSWGGFLVTWADDSPLNPSHSGQGVRAELFDGSGAPVGEPFQVDAQHNSTDVDPSVLVLSDSEAAIFYRAEGNPSGLLERTIELPAIGTQGTDVLNGGSGGDRIAGLAGNDTISGRDGNDALDGGDGNDQLNGGVGNDVLSGRAGTDTLTGGSGNDTFSDTAAGLNGDKISDFGIGDKIVITDAALSGFNFSVSGNVLTYTGGHLTLGLALAGTLVASAAPNGGVQLSFQQPALSDVNAIATQLVSGYWNGDAHHWAVTQGDTLTVDISTLTASEQSLARAALQEWTEIIGVHFQEVISGAQILFDHSEDPSGPIAATDATWSNGIMTSAHVQISSSWVNQYGSGLNTYGYQTYIHEIGHALGLGHPGNYNVTASYPADALFKNDSWSTSVMSYFDQQQNTFFADQGFSKDFANTPMVADILAMQQLYGLSTTTRSGDTTYTFGGAGSGTQCIYDAGGTDWIYANSYSGTQLIDLMPGGASNIHGDVGNVSIALGVIIENALGGSGADTILGNDANNYLEGSDGKDWLDGGSGDDTLVGDGPTTSFASADTLTGGGGSDTFLDTKAGHNGDTITDLSAGDRIVFSDATLGGFTFSLSGNTLTYTGGSLNLSVVPTGQVVAQAAAGGGVQLAVIQETVHNDFNGDGRSDVLWRSDGTGNITDWLGQANGGFIGNTGAAWNNASSSWHIVGTGDFNGDGRSDILWQSDSGEVTDWLGNASGGFAGNIANADNTVGAGWQVAGTGDFNGDGRSDVLWRNSTTGNVTDWLGQANGSFIGNTGAAWNNASSSWHIVGTGDFNGDGRSDILWQSDSGEVTDWLGTASGGFAGNIANADNTVGAGWQVAGTGDFNGDGRSDVLWRNSTTGNVTDWLGQANGSFIGNTGAAWNNASSSWHIVGTGDFNGDGRSDILWQSDSGEVTDWLGNASGGFTGNIANADNTVGAGWHVQPVAGLF